MKKGFTFVELIAIIVILGVVSSLALAGLKSTRVKARNTARLANVELIRGALQRYKNDNGFYPATLTPGSPLVGANGKTYLDKIPVDNYDQTCASPYNYVSLNDGFEYNINYCVSAKMDKLAVGSYVANPAELACQPDCNGKLCGSNGCGGVCGTCAIGQKCDVPWSYCVPEHLAVGDVFRGGKVIYVLQPTDPGYESNKEHGLIAALEDQSHWASWCNKEEDLSSTVKYWDVALGGGASNTLAIVAVCGDNTAAGVCNNYININSGSGSFSDWYLPDVSEMIKVYDGQSYFNNYADGHPYANYWTSNQSSNSKYFALLQKFPLRTYYSGSAGAKPSGCHVRCVRSF